MVIGVGRGEFRGTLLSLSPPPASLDDVELDDKPQAAPSESSTPASISLSSVATSAPALNPHSHRHGQPHSLSPQFFRYRFRHNSIEYTIQKKSAVKKGTQPFPIR